MVFPGGGQLYNGEWLKGGIFMLTELGLGGIAAMNYYNHAQGLPDTFNGDDPLSTAKAFTWFFAASYIYSIMDAYVAAHLSALPNEKLILQPDPGVKGIRISYQF